ncbi:MAG: phytanoyl-CoA dioxygenase family protein [Verrucomicrobia bacterium]|nr:phytanoyl-CoA dioxygenase family protein [Verrucomicrobiota bacterium]
MLLSGYRIFPRLFEPTLIAAALSAVEELCDSLHPGDPRWDKHVVPLAGLKDHRNPGISKETTVEVPFLLTSLPQLSPALRAVILFPSLWEAAREILESEDVVCHFSNVTRKPARIGPNISWHRDYPNGYICPRKSEHFFRFLIPLENMDEENGCTLAIPDTHLLGDEEALREPKDADYSKAIPLEAEAGAAIAIHPKLLHGGRENRSERNRNLIVVQFGRRTGDFLHDLNEEEIEQFT